MMEEVDYIPSLLNEEPVAFLAMTHSELKLAVGVLFAIWLPICLCVGFFLGKTLLGVPVAGGAVLGSMWLVGKRLKVIKRGKPKQYHMLALSAWLQDRGLAQKSFIRVSRIWDIHRRKR